MAEAPIPSALSALTFAVSIDGLCLGIRDPLKLPFSSQVCLKLSKHAKHIQEALSRRRVGVDRLLRRVPKTNKEKPRQFPAGAL
jgi:hypothetical protein